MSNKIGSFVKQINKKILRNICLSIICCLLGWVNITYAQHSLPAVEEARLPNNLDALDKIPKWLMIQVENALPNKGLNVWVPTYSFATSSLTRVPRFPKSSRDIKLIATDHRLTLEAVCNEQVSAQVAVAATDTITDLQVTIGDLKSKGGSIIKAENVQVRYVKYLPVQNALVGNTFKQIAGKKGLKGVSGFRDPDVVGDPLIELDKAMVPVFRAQPIWFTFHVPKQSRSGVYEAVIKIRSDQYKQIKLNLSVHVKNYAIPDPKNYGFNLDTWMNPFSVADYYNVKLWSKAHWKLLDRYFDNLASLGQKKILVTIIEKPWKKPLLNNKLQAQTYIGYNSMVKWRLTKDEQWEFDYNIFDKYVKNSLNHGIGPYISAYSMLTFRGPQRLTYYDEQKDKEVVEYLNVQDERYKKVWSIFLKSFSAHLKQKGWLDQTYLSFDERPAKLMKRILTIIREAAPEFEDKIYATGASKVDKIRYVTDLNLGYDYLPGGTKSNLLMKKAIKNRIKKRHAINFYVACCSASHPNRYSYSPAVESYILAWIALKYKLNGYADWAYNSWPKNVFRFPVFLYPQGDEYWIYPGAKGPMSSIRWELLKEGIEDFELIQVLKKTGHLDKKNENKVIKLMTRNIDGRNMNLQNVTKAKQILLDQK